MTDLERFNGAPAKEPIRSYVGLGHEADPRVNARLAVAEMERTGAFTRKIIAVAGTTGTGWINRSTVDSLEYMYNGDTATVAIQYSYLPSWLSFLVDNERCRRAGQALFEAVSARVRKIPEARRPKLVVFGEPRHLRRGGPVRHHPRHRRPHRWRVLRRSDREQSAVEGDPA